MTRELVTVDLGGTNARFAIATIGVDNAIKLDEPVTFHTAEHASFQTAWQAFGKARGRPLPRAAAIAIAGPVHGDVIRMTNNPWILRPALIRDKLDVDDFVLVNDFEAIGHAVATVGPDQFKAICGLDGPLPEGLVSIVGPGTGMGVAALTLRDGGYRVQATEGGHIDYAPLDIIEDTILARLRQRHRRVSAERVVSGPAIVDIYETLASIEGRKIQLATDREIWAAGLDGKDSLAAAAVDRFCMSLGSFAGDIALAQGASSVVVAGGLGLRLKDVLLQSGFAQRFRAKGRFEQLMQGLPVKLIIYPQPGLLGAAAAFAQAHK